MLAELFALAPGQTIHLRELARRAGVSPTAAQYELRALLPTGLAYIRYGLDILEGIPLDEFSSASFLEQQARRSIAAIHTLRAGKVVKRGSS